MENTYMNIFLLENSSKQSGKTKLTRFWQFLLLSQSFQDSSARYSVTGHHSEHVQAKHISICDIEQNRSFIHI